MGFMYLYPSMWTACPFSSAISSNLHPMAHHLISSIAHLSFYDRKVMVSYFAEDEHSLAKIPSRKTQGYMQSKFQTPVQICASPEIICPTDRKSLHFEVGLAKPPCLLFLRFSTPGVLGLFLLSLPFLVGVISVFSVSGVDLVGGANGPLATGGARSLSFSFLPVEERWNAPGSPVIGISSIYSSPYLHVMLSVSSRSTLSRNVLLFVD